MKPDELDQLLTNNLNAYKDGNQSLDETLVLIHAAFGEFCSNE